MCISFSDRKQLIRLPTGKCRYQMTSTDNLPWIQETKCILVRRWHETDFRQSCPLESMCVPRLCAKPPNPQEFHSAKLISIRNTLMRTTNFCMIDSEDPRIPVWFELWVNGIVGRRCMHHNVRAASWIQGIGLPLNIVCCVKYLTGADRVYSSWKNANRLAVGWCERAVSVTVKVVTKQATKEMVLQFWQEALGSDNPD